MFLKEVGGLSSKKEALEVLENRLKDLKSKERYILSKSIGRDDNGWKVYIRYV